MKYYYFDFYGKGEAIRMLLSYHKADWEEVRIKREDWPKLK